jgi:hypothetical protein
MPRFANLKGSMNPFDNNRPVLSSSDRLKNKRDATIYQAEKQCFQSKRRGNKNVKYYNNGAIKSMKSYSLQNSLSRGNVLCEDCDDKGLLCGGVSSKSALGSIQMGNNVVSEYWGGGFIVWNGQGFTQSIAFPVIQSDISGAWGGAPDKADLSGQKLPGSDPSANMFWGYINNLIKIPRNLDGSGIVIDPSNNLFPDEMCNAFKHTKSHLPYMKHSNLKTYLVVTSMVVLDQEEGPALVCGDPSLNELVGQPISSTNFVTEWTGVINRVCCKRRGIFNAKRFSPSPPATGDLFDIYVELQYVKDYVLLNKQVTMDRPYNPSGPMELSPFISVVGSSVATVLIWNSWVESFRIFQGSCELNQTKHNATKQSYMSCLENKTRKINFT